MSVSLDAIARHVLTHFGLAPNRVQFLGNHGGFSGARLWRVTASASDWCLKAWPANVTDDESLRTAHELMRRARDAGLSVVPKAWALGDGSSHVSASGRFWDLTSWLPGVADFHADPSPIRARAACRALAHLHRAWESHASPLPHSQPIPAIQRRLAAARAWRDLVSTGWRPAVPACDPVTPWAERAWAVARRLMPLLVEQLEPWLRVPLPIQHCLCDIWHDHVLFTGDAVTGIVDFASVKLDHVAVDLARLLGSLVGDDAAAVATGLDAYSEVRPLSATERALVPCLDRTGVLIGTANWLRWLYHEGREYDDRPAVAQRLADLVRRIEAWDWAGGSVVDSCEW